MEDKIRFGILGCGMIANIHAQAIASIEDAVLVGVTDSVETSAKAFAEKYGAFTYRNYDQMLADPRIDVVCICTPSGLHAQAALKALRSRKNVVLEKPMALSAEDADEVVRVCQETGMLLTVISQLRFEKDVQKVKQLVAEGEFGDLVFCDLYMKYWRDPEYYSSSPWKGTFQFDGGGALMNQGIHGVDLIHYIAGNARVVKGKVKTRFHDIEVEDLATAVMEFENGALGVIEASTCAFGGFDRRVEIIGTKGYAILVEGRIEKMEINGVKSVREVNAETGDKRPSNDPAAVQFEGHAAQIRNLIRAMQGKEALLIDAIEGSRAVKMICNIYKSSAECDKM